MIIIQRLLAADRMSVGMSAYAVPEDEQRRKGYLADLALPVSNILYLVPLTQ